MRRIFLASAVLASTAVSALAQNAGTGITRVVSFGDSLTDNGNLFIGSGGTQPPSPPYNKRFTNGVTFAELLNGPMLGFFTPATPAVLNANNVNYAFGGSRTDTLVANPPGIPTQIGAYLVRGGTFGNNTLVTYFGGANNIFQAFAIAAGNPATAQATMTIVTNASAADAGASLTQLAGAGARTVAVYNLPNFGSLPNFTALGASAVQLASFSSGNFNTSLNTATQNVATANRSVNFVQVDVAGAFAAVIANPAAFGFSNVTALCLTTPACGGGTFAQQNQYLFWDGVHPTQAGHQLLATLTQMYLYAPALSAGAAVLGDTGYRNRRGFMIDALDRSRAERARPGVNDFYVEALGETFSRNAGITVLPGVAQPVIPTSNRFTSTQGGVRIGMTRGLGAGWSIAANLSAITGNVKAGFISANATSLGADLAALWRSGPLFVNLGAGASLDLYNEYKRQTLLAPVVLSGSPSGNSQSVAAEIGYDTPFGALKITPVARLAYTRANVEAFSESGLTAVSFGSRAVAAASAAGELRFAYSLSPAAKLTAMIGYEALFSRQGGSLNGQLANNTALPFVQPVASLPTPGLQVGLGAEMQLAGMTLSANYRGGFGASGQRLHRANVALTTKW